MRIPPWLRPNSLFEYGKIASVKTSKNHSNPLTLRVEKYHWNMWMKVVDVYDGDTITVACVYRGIVVRWRCRLVGFDAPEMRSQSEEEKKAALASKLFLMTLLPRKVFWGKCVGLDKYGRILLELTHQGVAIQDIMVLNGHGYYYDGKTKQKFSESSSSL